MKRAARILAAAVVSMALYTTPGWAGGDGKGDIEYLFVQNAAGTTYDDGMLTLVGVSPTTIFFSDRPDRIVGHMPTGDFVDDWDKGSDNFKTDNPNAALSIFEEEGVIDFVVVLSRPVFRNGNLSYKVKLLDGELPGKGGACSLFVDVIGRPRSPLSVAGIARRTTMRHVIVANEETTTAEREAAEAKKAQKEADSAAKDAEETSAEKTKHSPEEKLQMLDKMRDEGLITDSEYNAKKEKILSSF